MPFDTKPMLCAFAAALALLALPPAQAQAPLGAGATPCSAFLKAARTSDIVYHQASNWLLGYVAGLTAGASPAPAPTSDEVLKAAGDFCEANPSRTVADAGRAWAAAQPGQAAAQPAQAGRSWLLDLNRRPERPGGPKP